MELYQKLPKIFATKKTERYLTQQDHVDLPDEPGPDGLVGERGPEALGQNNLDRTCLNITLGGHTHLGQLQSDDKFRVLTFKRSRQRIKCNVTPNLYFAEPITMSKLAYEFL